MIVHCTSCMPVVYLFFCYCLGIDRFRSRGSTPVPWRSVLHAPSARQEITQPSWHISSYCFIQVFFSTIILHSIPMSTFGQIIEYPMNCIFPKPLPVSPPKIHRFDVLAWDNSYVLVICLDMLILMFSCPVIYFPWLWQLIECSDKVETSGI